VEHLNSPSLFFDVFEYKCSALEKLEVTTCKVDEVQPHTLLLPICTPQNNYPALSKKSEFTPRAFKVVRSVFASPSPVTISTGTKYNKSSRVTYSPLISSTYLTQTENCSMPLTSIVLSAIYEKHLALLTRFTILFIIIFPSASIISFCIRGLKYVAFIEAICKC